MQRADVDPRAVRPVREHVVRDPDHGAVDRRVDVGAGSGADREHRRAGAAVAAQLVPDEARLARAGELVPEPREEAGVPLAPDRVELERAVAGVVVADRGHGALGDGQLQVQPARRRDDLAQRLAAGKHRRRRERLRRHRLRAPRAERGQKQGQEQDRRKESGKQEARSVPLGPPAARAQPLDLPAVARSGSARRHRMAGGGRSHGRHHSRPCGNLAPGYVAIGTSPDQCPGRVMTPGAVRRCCAVLVPCGRKAERA